MNKTKVGNISLILGIIAAIFIMNWFDILFNFFPVLFGIPAIITGIKAKKEGDTRKTGKILGIIALALGITQLVAATIYVYIVWYM